MTKRWSTWIIAGAAAACIVLSGGCRSDAYYQNRAAERARKYLLDEAKELTAEEKYFVTFNDPVFLTSPILGTAAFAKDRSLDAPTLNDQLQQICISWKLPKRDEWYMVYGASNGRMDFWYPERLIRKKFAQAKISELERATALSRTYARNNLFDLMSVAEQNFIRFHFPAVYETNFELNFNPTGKETPEKIEKVKTAAAKSTQYSLVWARPDQEEIAIFCGFGGAEMSGWKINFAGKTSADELRRHTVRIIKNPTEYYRAFPAPYAKPAEKKNKGTK